MKIKVAILDKDINYINRMAAAFSIKYSDKMEIYSFTEYEGVIKVLEDNKIDVLVASDEFDINEKELPRKCGFAYFVEVNNVESVKGQAAIFKFQKADLIYKQILSLYSEKASDISGIRLGDDNCKTVAFISPAGGTGASTMAAAYATACSKMKKKALYLNFETLGSSDIFFHAEGQFDMSDIIYALNSKKTNISLKIESCVKQDAEGVYFFSRPKTALDIMEMNADEKLHLLSELQLAGTYDYIIIDMEFGLGKENLEILSHMHSIVLVSDGTEISNTKTLRAWEALNILEQSMDVSITGRIAVIYNKFSNKSGTVIENEQLKGLSGAPRFEHATAKQIVSQISTMNMFEKLL